MTSRIVIPGVDDEFFRSFASGEPRVCRKAALAVPPSERHLFDAPLLEICTVPNGVRSRTARLNASDQAPRDRPATRGGPNGKSGCSSGQALSSVSPGDRLREM